MKLNKTSGPTTRRDELLDAVIDGYVTWREESVAVATTYHDWNCAPRDERRLAFDSYYAAPDREEEAAASYQDALSRTDYAGL